MDPQNEENASKLKKFNEIKQEGNVAFLEGKMHEAIKAYTKALELFPTDSKVLSYRGEAYIKVQAYANAKEDILKLMSLEGSSPNIKTLNQLCFTMWNLKQYDEIISCLENASTENKSDLESLIIWSKRLKNESISGTYNIPELIQKKQQIYNCAEYTGPIKIDYSLGKGRGIFASEDIKEGTIIMGCKAFAIVFPEENEDKMTNVTPKFKTNEQGEKYIEDPKHEALVNKIVEIIQENPSSTTELYKLYAGPNLGIIDEESDGDPSKLMGVDLQRINNICYYNAFFSATNPNPDSESIPDRLAIDEFRNVNTYGLWLLPSYLNHSCVNINCDVQKYGDFMIVRAIKNISKGEELFMSYIFPTASYKERKADFSRYGFVCSCPLCQLEQNEQESVTQKREELMRTFLEACLDPNVLPEKLEEIESQLQEVQPEMNFSLFWTKRQIGLCHSYVNNHEKAALSFEAAYNLSKHTSLAREGIRILINICICYRNASNTDKLREWANIFVNDVRIVYGTIDVIPTLALRENIPPHIMNKIINEYCNLS